MRCPHPPGHKEAVKLGCLCPVYDNSHGKGSGYLDGEGNPTFWYNDACPIHGGSSAEPIDGDTVLIPE